ncbi:SMAD/FHA domain [Phaffia rhodozyma]|uniref:SMAD/FHA domain n=1 Tax=Phaffia rhodozyma TaxID=264483 RepID=A0A0F7SV51_PHARH|nr:SMAD/FHA domain [Phaffia rhodozyma]
MTAAGASHPPESTPSNSTWTWQPEYGLFYHPGRNLWAQYDQTTGEYKYLPPSSTEEESQDDKALDNEEREEGEISDDGGPTLNTSSSTTSTFTHSNRYHHHPEQDYHSSLSSSNTLSFSDASKYAFPGKEEPACGFSSVSTVTPARQLKPYDLRLLRVSSSCLSSKHKLAILSSSQPDGYAIGRDKQLSPEEGRVRLKELEVSKSHAVVYFVPPEMVSTERELLVPVEEEGWGGTYLDRDAESSTSEPQDKLGTANSSKAKLEENKGAWWIVDSGSTHGSFIGRRKPGGEGKLVKKKWKRLSEAKKASLPEQLQHGDFLRIGSTTFEIHLHPTLPCSECSLSDASSLIPTSLRPESASVEDERAPPPVSHPTMGSQPTPKDHMRQLRETLLSRPAKRLKPTSIESVDSSAAVSANAPSSSSITCLSTEDAARIYHDRAAIRRQQRPSVPLPQTSNRSSSSINPLPPAVPAQTVDSPLGNTNIGHAMLMKHGWIPGKGLGVAEEGGRVDPVEVVRPAGEGKSGIGIKPILVETKGVGDKSLDWRDQGKARRFREMGL